MPSWLLMTTAQKNALVALGVFGGLAPKAVTNSTMVGLWACPTSLLDDPKYAEWAQGLSYLPLRTMSETTLFS